MTVIGPTKPLILVVYFLLGSMLTLLSTSTPAIQAQAQEQLQTQDPRIENLADRNDLEMQSVPAAVSSIDLIIERILIQENQCQGVDAFCTNNGANEFLVGSWSSGGSSDISQVDAFIQQHLRQENECRFNGVLCTNDGLNRVSLGSSSL
jgi:hypothetical protein